MVVCGLSLDFCMESILISYLLCYYINKCKDRSTIIIGYIYEKSYAERVEA